MWIQIIPFTWIFEGRQGATYADEFHTRIPVQRGIIETMLAPARASEDNLDEIPSTNNDQPQATKAWPSVAVPTVKSLYIETYFGEQRLSSATCFLLSRTKESHCVVITNRHVVTGRHQSTGALLDSRGGIPDAVVIHFNKAGSSLTEWVPIRLPLYRGDGWPFWIEHPHLGAAGDLVALNVKWGSDVEKLPYYLDLDLDRVEMVLSPAESVSVIGFPFGISSYAKYPIWATGFLAQDLGFISQQNPTFYIDCRSRQGQSGSPVIAFRTQGARVMKEGRVSATLSPTPQWEFLGVYSGRVNTESDLGIVWHVSTLGALVDAADADMRERALLHTDRAELP